ncbi:Zn-dependent peptidase ImmA (M78 family) [Nocardia transvalensis]|uniref:Zn-dependent peptidase ImmA (M78 family) n=1 Tax=Nocardia transvalensis TaxID=37333 RepID=A0A7W9PBT3_9NOCA|nr:ImmA/IrrE family metallo-endopeptidase [Nocardia transvalensis]MBB5913116.1 Zn-dependent peptidase ImmA (M78 family) [Nocardia transvalensis]
MTKTALAEAMAVTVRTINDYERKGPPASAIATLAAVLGCKPEFFDHPAVDDLSEDRVFFRARRRASATQRRAAIAAGQIGVELYAWIDKHFQLPDVYLPEVENTDPVETAASVRALWGLGERPLPNLIQLAESKGIRVLSLPRGTDLVDAFSVWSDDKPYVFLSMSKTPERSRFDLAHEIGHLVLHPGLPEGGNAIEREADRFASALLMPPSLLRSSLPREPSVTDILEYKKYFRVSAMALNYALRDAGRLTEWGHRQNCVRLSELGYRSGEPAGMPQHETSRVFSAIFRSREGRARIADVAAELGLPVSELHAMTFGSTLHTVAAQSDAGPESKPAPARPALKLVRSQ